MSRKPHKRGSKASKRGLSEEQIPMLICRDLAPRRFLHCKKIIPVALVKEVRQAPREDGSFFWNGEQVEVASLPERFALEAKKQPQPERHIHADRLTHYELVAQVMSGAAKAGVTRIGFVTDPLLMP